MEDLEALGVLVPLSGKISELATGGSDEEDSGNINLHTVLCQKSPQESDVSELRSFWI